MSIQILKENEEGYGILIEGDSGFISQDFNKSFLSEGTINNTLDLTKPIIYYATLQKYDVENRNGRVYPEKILRREATRYLEVIERNASYSELDHPDSPTIALKGGSPFRIIELFWKGNALIGKLEVLVSHGYRNSGIISCNGDMLAHYLSYGMTVGISSRGIGTLKKSGGKNVVQDDYEIICWDAVTTPSTPGSYLYKDMSSFKEYDEVLKPEKVDIGEKSNKNDDFMSRLNSFLGK